MRQLSLLRSADSNKVRMLQQVARGIHLIFTQGSMVSVSRLEMSDSTKLALLRPLKRFE